MSVALKGLSEEGALRVQAKLVEMLRNFSTAEPEILAKFTVSVLEDLQRQSAAGENKLKLALSDALAEFNSNQTAVSDLVVEVLEDLRRENWLLLTDPKSCKNENDGEDMQVEEEAAGRDRWETQETPGRARRKSFGRDQDEDDDRSRGRGRGGYRRRSRSRSRSPPGGRRHHRDARGGDRGGQRDDRGRRRDRGGDRNDRRDRKQARSTLHIAGLPTRDPNLERKLRSHFYRFGLVLDLKLRGENGFVQYKQRKDAERALGCPDAILGNRFITAQWAKFDNLNEEEVEKKGKEAGEKKKKEIELKEKLLSIQKQKEALLLRQLEHQKNLVAQLQAKKGGPPAPAPAQGEGEEPAAAGAGAEGDKGGAEPAEGAATSAPLSASAAPFVARGRGRGRGSGRGRGRGRGGFQSSYRLTTGQTKTVKISNIPDNMDVDKISGHFGKYGSIVKADKTLGGDIVMEFENREAAEQAIIKGKKVAEEASPVIMQWVFS